MREMPMVIFFRTIILYLLVILVMRLMGKRQIGQLQPYELVVAIMISDLAAIPMQNISVPLLNGIIPILTLLASQLFISLLLMKNVRIRGIVCGRPTILIHKGKIVEENLRKEMFTLNDLIEAIRICGYSDISEIYTAILETNGTVSVFPKSKYKNLTAGDMSLSVDDGEISINLIIDGTLLEENLQQAGLSRQELEAEIKKYGARSVKDVLICTVKNKNQFFVQLIEKNNNSR